MGPFRKHAGDMCQTDQAKDRARGYDISLHLQSSPRLAYSVSAVIAAQNGPHGPPGHRPAFQIVSLGAPPLKSGGHGSGHDGDAKKIPAIHQVTEHAYLSARQ